MIEKSIFAKCVGCKSRNTTVGRAVKTADNEERFLCTCDFCGGEWLLPNDADIEYMKKEKHIDSMRMTSFLALLYRQFS